MIIINGTSLTVEQVAAVARTGEQVAISNEAKAAVNKARAYVEKKLDEKAVVYGLTTGFGKFSDKYIPLEDTAALQRNLIISHSCGMGNPLPTEVVRAARRQAQGLHHIVHHILRHGLLCKPAVGAAGSQKFHCIHRDHSFI